MKLTNLTFTQEKNQSGYYVSNSFIPNIDSAIELQFNSVSDKQLLVETSLSGTKWYQIKLEDSINYFSGDTFVFNFEGVRPLQSFRLLCTERPTLAQYVDNAVS